MRAWYFSQDPPKLRYGDGRKIREGRTHTVDPGRLEMCRYGLHASPRILDALSYAPGSYLWRVELGGKMSIGNDKAVASERTYLWGIKANDVLAHFARLCALDVVDKWGKPAPEVVIKYLRTGKPELRSQAERGMQGTAPMYSSAVNAAWEAIRWTTHDYLVANDVAQSACAAVANAASKHIVSPLERKKRFDATWEATHAKLNRRLTRMILEARFGVTLGDPLS